MATGFQTKKLFLKLRSLSFNFAWVFGCLVTLNHPLVEGKNEYFFNPHLRAMAERASCSEGVFYFIELPKLLRFLEAFFSFSALECEVLEQLVFQSAYFTPLRLKGKRDRVLVQYDRFLSLVRYAVLTEEGSLTQRTRRLI